MPQSNVEVTQKGLVVQRKRSPLRRWLAALGCALLVAAGLLFLLSRAGSFLVVDSPQPSDAAVVLEGAGDTGGYTRALDLMRRGYAREVLLAANATPGIFGRSEADLARHYLHLDRQPFAEICPTTADTLYAEAADVQRCLELAGARSAILVTNDFQTRRALAIFRKRLPQYRWSVATPSPIYHFAVAYWKHRAWAKTVLQEWEDFLWWKLADQWGSDVVLQRGGSQ